MVMQLLPVLLDKHLPAIRDFFYKISRKDRAVCLCFHDVADTSDVYAIEINTYKKIIDRIQHKIVSINNIEADNYVVSFDDGYESVYTTVFPYMVSRSIPFVCYITTGFINKPGYLTDDQIKEISKSEFCTIGSHMCTHHKTREMNESDIQKEWNESKLYLEKLTGSPVLHAALPYGSFSSCTIKSKRIALKCGYKTIADTIASYFSPHSSFISRYVYQKNNDRVDRIINSFD